MLINVRRDVGHLKEALGGSAHSVHNALGDSLPVKVGDLLHQLVVLQQQWACRLKTVKQRSAAKVSQKRKTRTPVSHGDRVVVVPYRRARIGGPIGRVVGRAGPILRRRVIDYLAMPLTQGFATFDT